jgi:pyruvate formate-lyase activating enzyme-like uncharacterized protein
MRKIRLMKDKSAYFGKLPPGCTFCGPGEKLVLLITGKCPCRCFYCPLSFAKRGKKVIYANEMKAKNLKDIISEAKAISAKGTGITGGDPMLVPKLTLEAIRLLKKTFGKKHHIHLYTSGKFEPKYVKLLETAGLDELRFHPPLSTWNKVDEKFEKLLKLALKSKMSIGSEIPVLPGYKDATLKFARYLDRLGVEFLNLNELELSESNLEKCEVKGYHEKSSVSNAVFGSEELSLEILYELSEDAGFKMRVHYCSAQFKDRQQLRNRLRRRAKNVIRPFEVLTDDDTFLLGVIEPGGKDKLEELEAIRSMFIEKYQVPQDLLNLDMDGKRLEIAPWVLQELKIEFPKSINKMSFIIEEYPTADRLEVERVPLGKFN